MIHVTRSEKAPTILSSGTAQDRYRSKEVVERLYSDFHEKCYICEIGSLQSAEVEHLRPHKDGSFPELKFAWDNLFLSCRHCNSVKNKAKYDAGIIDCCKRDPEILLDQELVEDSVSVSALVVGDDEVKRTAELIEEVFMSENPPLRSRESDMRLKKLQQTMNILYKNLEACSCNRDDVVARRTVKAMLKPEAQFAGFTRCYVRKHLRSFPEFSVCLTSCDF